MLKEGAFYGCTSLKQIRLPPSVKVVDASTFGGYTQLKNVELAEGLECIECRAFAECKSLRRVRKPSTVTYIHTKAFEDCKNSVAIDFSEEFEQFVNEYSLQSWFRIRCPRWEKYSLLTRWNIPRRCYMMMLTTGKMDIRTMLNRLPSITLTAFHALDGYVDMINSELVKYEQYQKCVTALLENSGVCFIVPQVLSFLLGSTTYDGSSRWFII